MEPVGFVASVITLAETTFHVVEYLHDLKGGGKQRLKLSAEVSALWVVINSVKEQLEGSSSALTLKYLRKLRNPDGALSQCEKVVEELQQKLRPQHGLKAGLRAISWPLEKQETLKFVDRVHRLQMAINTSFAQANLAISEQILTNGHAVKQMLDDREVIELLDWLSPLNFSAEQNQHYGQRCYGTGEWFLESDYFRAWMSGRFPVLLCQGIPGSGKTVMSSIVVAHLREQNPVTQVPVLGIYCDFKSSQAGMHNLETLIGSLVKQAVQACSGIPSDLKSLHHKCRRSGTSPNVEELTLLLVTRLSTFKRSFIVVDALDELESVTQRAALMKVLNGLSSTVSIMITGRAGTGLEKSLALFGLLHYLCDVCESGIEPYLFHCGDHPTGGYDVCQSCFEKGTRHCPEDTHAQLIRAKNTPMLRIRPKDADIVCYTKTRIREDENLQTLVAQSPSLEVQIVQAVPDLSHSMFLLAKLYMDHLASIDSVRGVLNALRKTPDDLTSTYDQAMQRINSQSATRMTMAKEVLKWVLLAKRPLQGREMEHAIKIVPSIKVIDHDDIVLAKKLVTFCGGLVHLDFDGCFRFVHYTTEEYFRTFCQYWFPDAEATVATSCLTYLLLDAPCTEIAKSTEMFQNRLDRYTFKERHPFYAYAAYYWGIHAKSATRESIHQLAMCFLSSQPHCYAASLWLYFPHMTKIESAASFPAIHLAAHFGMDKAVEELVGQNKGCLETQDIFGLTPLLRAALSGQTEVIKLLVQAGANVNSVNANNQSALFMATTRRHPTSVLALLECDAVDVNIPTSSSPNGTAFVRAASYGSCPLVEAFLRRPDLDVNFHESNPSRLTALSAAALGGHLDVVRLLLADSRTNTEIKDIDGQSVLSLVAAKGYFEMVKLLLEKGANIESRDNMSLTPLMRAVESGQRAIVLILRERGADVSATDYFKRSILHLAAESDSSKTLCDILRWKSDVDINAQQDSGETALHEAAKRGFSNSVRLLLRHLARVDIEDHRGITASVAAAMYGHSHIVGMAAMYSAAANDVLKCSRVSPTPDNDGTDQNTSQGVTEASSARTRLADDPTGVLTVDDGPEKVSPAPKRPIHPRIYPFKLRIPRSST